MKGLHNFECDVTQMPNSKHAVMIMAMHLAACPMQYDFCTLQFSQRFCKFQSISRPIRQ